MYVDSNPSQANYSRTLVMNGTHHSFMRHHRPSFIHYLHHSSFTSHPITKYHVRRSRDHTTTPRAHISQYGPRPDLFFPIAHRQLILKDLLFFLPSLLPFLCNLSWKKTNNAIPHQPNPIHPSTDQSPLPNPNKAGRNWINEWNLADMLSRIEQRYEMRTWI